MTVCEPPDEILRDEPLEEQILQSDVLFDAPPPSIGDQDELADLDDDLLVEIEGTGDYRRSRPPRGILLFTVVPVIASVGFHVAVIAVFIWWVGPMVFQPRFAHSRGSNSPSAALSMQHEDAVTTELDTTPLLVPPSKEIDSPKFPTEKEEPAVLPAPSQEAVHLSPLEVEQPSPIIGVGYSIAQPHFQQAVPGPTTRSVAANRPSQPAHSAPAHGGPPAMMIAPRIASLGAAGNGDDFDERGLPLPEYPAESRLRHEQGLVEVDVEVLPDGSVGQIKLLNDSGLRRLGEAAVEAMHRARKFDPATIGGVPVTGHLIIPFQFVLK
jgi:periplasmic protein TonB